MATNGIRISDAKNNVICVGLKDILEEIDKGDQLYWSILDFYGMGNLGRGKSIPAFIENINKSERGLIIKWDELILLASCFWQVFDILIIGCANNELVVRYNDDRVMYETCDIVIEMIDGGFWQVFSRDRALINRLATKFKEIEFLKSDFER